MKLFRKLSEKLNKKSKKLVAGGMTSPVEFGFDVERNEFLDNLSKKALKMYERQTDIKNFSKLVLSDPENQSHVDLYNDLLEKGIVDPLEDEKLEKLADNAKFLKDLGLTK